MQYFRPTLPTGGPHFAGDCMPFFHAGVFHLYYLLDENHHKALNGLGGHQWAHASSINLVDWEHHPLAIGITSPEEGSICTGSVFYHEGVFYGFYATRRRDWTQHLSLAASSDGVHFHKEALNVLAAPGEGYSPYHFRDPCALRDPETGLFHLLVTAQLEPYPLTKQGGCLAHLVSTDLQTWTVEEPLLIPGYGDPPECPDYFFWNGWYYLIFSNSLVARYRMARHPLGPWLCPPVDTLDGRLARVMKTAAFTGNRRIGVAWLGTRQDDKDDGKLQWGGHLLFREILQTPDGALTSRFPPEMTPTGTTLHPPFSALTPGVTTQGEQIQLHAPTGLAVGVWAEIPQDVRIRLQVKPETPGGSFGLRLRGSGQFEQGYDLRIQPVERLVKLHDEAIYAVEGLDQPFTLEVICKEDILDVCIDGRRCLVNRCPEQRGDRLFLFAHNSSVSFTGELQRI